MKKNELRNKWVEQTLKDNEPEIDGIDKVRFGKPTVRNSSEFIKAKVECTQELILSSKSGFELGILESAWRELDKKIRKMDKPKALGKSILYIFNNGPQNSIALVIMMKVKDLPDEYMENNYNLKIGQDLVD